MEGALWREAQNARQRSALFWLGREDSNPRIRIQNPLSYL